VPLSDPSKLFGLLQWKKTAKGFEPKIHQFTQNQVIMFFLNMPVILFS